MVLRIPPVKGHISIYVSKPAFLVFCGTPEFFLCGARCASVVGRTSGSEIPPMFYHGGGSSACCKIYTCLPPLAMRHLSRHHPSIIQGFQIPGDVHYHMSLQRHMRNSLCWVIRVTYLDPIYFLGSIYVTLMTFYEFPHRPPNCTVGPPVRGTAAAAAAGRLDEDGKATHLRHSHEKNPFGTRGIHTRAAFFTRLFFFLLLRVIFRSFGMSSSFLCAAAAFARHS
jgi:hypothetical protein